MADPKIKLKRSAVAGKIPTPDQLPLGEVALNTFDGYLYASKNVGVGTTVIALNPFRVGTGTDTYNAYFTAGDVGIGTTNPKAKLEINVGSATTALDIQGSAGQLFSVTNNLTSGSIFSVNDVSGIPSIDVNADGTIQLAPYGSTEYVGIGTTNPTSKLDVTGHINVSGVVTATSFSGSGSNLTGLTGASAATYGDANATPVIVVDSDGRITGISTVAISGSGSLATIVEDTTPQLGGDLDLNSNDITGTGNVNITGVVTATSFVGSVTGTASTADTLKTVNTPVVNANHFITFVDTNNSTSTAEVFKTDNGLYYNPYLNQFAANGVNTGVLSLNSVDVTATAAELNILDGVTASTSELNILDGVTATTSELNVLDGITATTSELNLTGDLGTFTGSTISDNATIKAALQEIETSLESISGGDAQSASVAVGATNTNASHYITFVDSNNTSPTQELIETDAGISYNPSSNVLTVSGSVAANVTGTASTATVANTVLTRKNETSGTYYFTFVDDNNTVASANELYTDTTLNLNPFTNIVSGGGMDMVTYFKNSVEITASAAEQNILDGATLSTSELNILDGVTATTSEINVLDGATAGSAVASKALVVDSNRDIDNLRRVGIGTDSPTQSLEVSGSKAWFKPNETGADATALSLGRFSNTNGSFYDIDVNDATGDTVVQRINRYTGTWRFNRSSPDGEKTTIIFDTNYLSGNNVGIYNTEATHYRVRFQGEDDCYFNNVGNVGIKSTAPSVELDVNGAFSVSGVSTFSSDINIGDKITYTDSSDILKFGDDAQLRFGDGNDLQIYHNGSNSYIKDTGTGALIFASNIYSFRNAADSEQLAKFTENGAAELYHDNSKKFETASGGVTVTGTVTADGLSLGDNEYANFGDGNDLSIYHTGSISYISDQGTGALRILSNAVKIRNAADTEQIANFTQNGSVELYYDNSKKFETTGYGVTVFGTTQTQQLNVTGVSTFTSTVEITPSSDVQGLIIDTTNVTTENNAHLTLKGGGPQVIDFRDNGGGNGIRISYRTTPNEWRLENSESNSYYYIVADRDDGRVDLYHGGSKKFETTSSGVSVTGISTATVLYGTGGTYADGVDTVTDAALIIGRNAAIYTDDGDYLRVLIEKQDDVINIGQQNTAIIDGIELKPGTTGGSVKLHAGGSTDNVKLQTIGAGVTVYGTTQTQQLNVSGVSTFASDINIGDKITYTDSSDILKFGDDAQLRFGDGNDLQIFHDGSNSYVRDLGTGILRIETDGSSIGLRKTSGESMGVFNTDGSVDLYYDNAKKFETTADGIKVHPNVGLGTVAGNSQDLASFETTNTNGSKLRIIEERDVNGTTWTSAYTRIQKTIDVTDQAYIQFNGDGNTYGMEFGNAANGEKFAEFKQNSSVDLYHNGVKKFETASYGIYVTGAGNTSTIAGAANLVLDPSAVGDNTGTVTILGNLQVDGTQTVINSTTMTVDDLNITLASGAANASAANGAGITVDGASATLTYASSGDKWVFNKAPYYNSDRLLTTADEGTGNGIDADTVDGIEASSFLRSDANDSASGLYSFAAGAYSANVTYGGRSIQTNLDINSTSMRGGLLVRNANDYRSETDSASFMHYDAYDTSATSYAFRAAKGATLSDTFWVKGDGRGYFSGLLTLSGGLNVSGVSTFSGGQVWASDITWNSGENILINGESSFDVRGGGSWAVWDQSTADNWIIASYGQPLVLNNNALNTTVKTSGSSDYFRIYHRTDTDITMDFYCESGTAQIADTFTDTTTDKKYIYFGNPNSSNDPGFIMHETSNSETNEGVLHLVPSDDNATNDYVSIHGTNDADQLRLHTSGLVESVAGQLELKSGSGGIYLNDDVGIGNDNPTVALELGKTKSTNQIKLKASDGNVDLRINPAFGNADVASMTVVGAYPLTFHTNNTERIRIESGGDVGIGTDNPGTKLDVRGDTRIFGGSLNVSDNQTTAGYGHIKHHDDYHAIILRGFSSDTSGTPSATNQMSFVEYGGVFNFYKTNGTDNNNFVRFSEGGNSWINASGGNLGIGTNNPQANFVVSNSGNNGLEFDPENSSGTNRILSYNRNSAQRTKLEFDVSEIFVTNNTTEYLRLNSTGLGIGTNSPSTSLHVSNGTSGFSGSYNGRTAAVVEGDDSGGTTLSILAKSSGYSGIFFGDEDSETRGQIQYVHSNDAFKFITDGGTEALRLDGGKVGIGTDSPDQELHVMGQVKISASDYARVEYARNNANLWTVGIRDTDDFIFYRESGSGNVIFPHGDVGIGTTNPSHRLHVYGSEVAAFGPGATNGNTLLIGADIPTSTDADTAHIELTNGNLHIDTTEGSYGIYLNYFGGQGGTVFGNGSSGNVGKFHSDGTLTVNTTSVTGTSSQKLNVNGGAHVSGNLGVGVTNPAGKLHISSGTSGDCELILEADTDNNTETDNPRILFRQDGGNDWSAIGNGVNGTSGSNDNALVLANSVSNYGGIIFQTNNNDTGYSVATERMRITSAGDVGIGTNNPQQKLNVFNATASDTGGILVQNATYTGNEDRPYLTVGTKGWTGATTNWNTYGFQHRIKSNSGGTPRITVDTSSGEKFCIENSGDVGIGTNAPDAKLDVRGHIKVDDGPTLENGGGGDLQVTTSDGYIRIGPVNGSFAHVQTDRSKFYFNKKLIVDTGTISSYNEDLILQTDDNGGGDERVRILASNGNLGVGATNPGEKLDVRGNLRVGGTDTGPNYIAFRGTTGDQPGSYNHGYIGERIYNQTEQSELLIAKGNDTPTTGGGADRVRIAAAEFRVDTYDSASGSSGTFEQVATNSNLSNRFVVTSGGNVGVGLTNPGYDLEVAGNIKLADTGTLWFSDTSGSVEKIKANTSSLDYYSDSVHRFYESDTNAERATFDVNNASGRLYFDGDSNTYFTREATDCHVFVNAGSESVRINASGDVGIGTAAPGYKLHVLGSFAATTKSFVIDHPTKEGMKLRYGSLEGPENGVYVRGRLKGNDTIELPDYWTGLVDEETITVNLTPIGRKAPLHSVVDIAENTVIVESANDTIDCFYTVFGERKDVEKLEVEF